MFFNFKRKRGKIIVISGPSAGVGKGTIIRELLKDKSLKFEVIPTATSRKPRDKNDKKIFLSKKEFKEKIKNNEFYEWIIHNFNNQYYGTLKTPVDKVLKKGKNVLLEIEYRGFLNIKEQVKDTNDILGIFILPPSMKVLEKRLRTRNSETDSEIKDRLKNAKKEILYSKHYEHKFINDDLDICVDSIKKLIKKSIS